MALPSPEDYLQVTIREPLISNNIAPLLTNSMGFVRSTVDTRQEVKELVGSCCCSFQRDMVCSVKLNVLLNERSHENY